MRIPPFPSLSGIAEGSDKSSIAMTLDLYSHLAPGMQESAASSLNGLVADRKRTMPFPIDVGLH